MHSNGLPFNHIFKVFNKLQIILIIIIFDLNFVQAEPLIIQGWVNTETGKSFEQISSVKSNGISFEKKYNNFNSKFQLNLLNDQTFSLDESNFNFNFKNTNIGIGKLKRHWSYSPITSLILSSHARPSNSVYINIKNKNKINNKFFSWLGPTSFEFFNSVLSNEDTPQNTMLLGARFELNPINNFKFEILKTSQWGGDGHSKSASALSAALIGNTNDKTHKNINQLAGYGFSYKIKSKLAPIKIYGQAIGEDEAGNLPMCFMYLFGLETMSHTQKFPSKIGFEIIDTRIDTTTNNNCGPNTAYNNHYYKYQNYGENLGAFIGTEGKSINIWIKSKIRQKTDLYYSLRHSIINDTNWSENSLSSIRQQGWNSKLKITWKHNSYKLYSQINYQDFSLIKKGIKEGFNFDVGIKYIF